MLSARPVRGRFRTLRTWANVVLIAVLLGIPWIRIQGDPLVWLDIPGRKFHVFGLVIFPQELLFLWLLIAGVALALFLFTALAGRVWCGWACPQTVFTDVFAGIARRIQGWSAGGPPRRIAPWRKALTHLVFLAIALVVGVHVVGYFHPIDALLASTFRGEPPAVAGGFVLVLSALAYLDFAFVRQTFCKFLCPYARLQSVLFDRDTLVIGYDAARGEPRGKRGSTAGDCVDCGLCVAVCPSEIDIRDGMQLECITCTQCIDACDGVMARLGRKRGLIDYRAWVSLEGLREARIFRSRVLVYTTMLAVIAGSFLVLLGQRVPVDFDVEHNRSQMFGSTGDGRLTNAYTVFITNRDREAHAFEILLDAPDGFELVAGSNPVSVAPIRHVETRVFVVVDPGAPELGAGAMPISFRLRRSDGEIRELVRESTFVAPVSAQGSAQQGAFHGG